MHNLWFMAPGFRRVLHDQKENFSSFKSIWYAGKPPHASLPWQNILPHPGEQVLSTSPLSGMPNSSSALPNLCTYVQSCLHERSDLYVTNRVTQWTRWSADPTQNMSFPSLWYSVTTEMISRLKQYITGNTRLLYCIVPAGGKTTD